MQRSLDGIDYRDAESVTWMTAMEIGDGLFKIPTSSRTPFYGTQDVLRTPQHQNQQLCKGWSRYWMPMVKQRML